MNFLHELKHYKQYPLNEQILHFYLLLHSISF